MINYKHLFWVPVGMIVAFCTSFIFGDLLTLPPDLYYLIYFVIVFLFFFQYVKRTNADIKKYFSKRLIAGVIFGLIFAVLMIMNVLSRPETYKLSGLNLIWEIFWRGLIYGTIDGLLLTVFPWLVTWRAFNAEEKPLGKKIYIALISWVFIIFMTTAYHLGYKDFRSSKILQANIGNTIMSVPTLITANPVAAPIAHAALHISAVIHSPGTELFLPPHR